MARPHLSERLRRRVSDAAQHRCGYCLTSEAIAAMPMHVEHIVPLASGGSSDEANLWLACALCNGYKGTQTHHVDPATDEHVMLFNPRIQRWTEHFCWSENGVEVVGITGCGRATISALKLNNEFLVRARRRWVAVGWHPPSG